MNKKSLKILVGTSGWYYKDWIGKFYPEGIKSYADLKFYSGHFNTVENNSSFYRMPSASAMKQWDKHTPPGFIFSIKLNQSITHYHQLSVTPACKALLKEYFSSVLLLKEKLGAILIQLPARFKFNLPKLEKFLIYYTKYYPVPTAIEFRNQYWFNQDTYKLLRKYNIALTVAQSSRYPSDRQVTANFAYFRFHGPAKLFASSYSDKELKDWARYIKECSRKVKTIYIYFNNDFHGYAIVNGKSIKKLLGVK